MLSNFLTIPVARQKRSIKIALAILTGAPTKLVNKMIDTPLFALSAIFLIALKAIKTLSM